MPWTPSGSGKTGFHRRRAGHERGRAQARRPGSWLRSAVLLTLALLGCRSAVPPPPLATPVTTVDSPSRAKPMPDRSQLPSAAPTPAWTPPTPETWRLRNGMRVWFVQQGPTPLVTLLLVLPRGSATDPEGKAGLAALMADMLDEGAGGLDAIAIAERLRELATDFHPSADVDATLLYMNSMADTLEPSIALLGDLVRRPTFDGEEFARRKDHHLAAALTAEAETATVRALVTRRVLFGDGYAGELPRGTRRTLASISLADVQRHYRETVAPQGAEFVVVGGVDSGLVREALERTFGDWQGRPARENQAVADPLPPAIYLVDFPGATQSAIAMTRRAEGMGSSEYFPAMIYNRSFGEAFTSRLNMNLREDKGFTYGARSTFMRYAQAGFYGLVAAVKGEATRASIDEMRHELADMCGKRPLTQEERDEAVAGLLLGFPGRFQRTDGVAEQFASLPIYGRPADWFDRWPANVEAVTLNEANRVAQKYCDPSTFSVVVVGDRARVEPTLSGLGLPVVGFDAQGGRLP